MEGGSMTAYLRPKRNLLAGLLLARVSNLAQAQTSFSAYRMG
jgi:hypothetical protein